MQLIQGIAACGVMILAALFGVALPPTARASELLYKNYVIRQDQGRDILCDTYIVQQNDFVLKLFRDSGEISHTDFPEFLNIFSRINPNITNINRIQSGQRVLIPLKKISPESLPGQQTGVVTIPFMTISAFPELLKSYQVPSPPPPPQSAPLSSLEKAAKLLEAKVFNKGAYYFPRPGADDLELNLSRFPVLELPDRSRALIVPPFSSFKPGISESDVAAMKSFWKSLSILAVDPNAPTEEILEAFFNSIENKATNNTVSFSDNGVQVSVRARWWLNQTREKNQSRPANNKRVGFVPPMDPEAGNTAIILEYLSKHDIVLKEIKDEEKETPSRAKSSVLLPPVLPSAPPEALVTALMTALALPYSPGVAISFPYGGIQIPAVSNLISTGEGRSILVDFGNLYGEAIEAIEKSGLGVVLITPRDSRQDTIQKLLTATGHSYETNPTFAAAKAPGALGAEISIPGFLISRGGVTKTLVSRVLLDPALIRFLNERGIKIVQIDEEKIDR